MFDSMTRWDTNATLRHLAADRPSIDAFLVAIRRHPRLRPFAAELALHIPYIKGFGIDRRVITLDTETLVIDIQNGHVARAVFD